MTDARWQHISRLYNDAAMLPADARAQFLRDACGRDDELRAEIESLLAGDSRADALLEGREPSVNLIGQRIGVYEITSLLGVGGMGEVYRARDTRLGRDVAVKVLPAEFARNPERLARFEREARVLASLKHPRIGAIHGLEDASGVPALVLELVEGQTLADRLTNGPIPIREAVLIARQIADALEAAHEQGIVHRDLKPANVAMAPDGTVKVLDFGLAKGTADGMSNIGATESGIILGTPAYMSPEQARGQRVDKRTDIWAFGCVLYEMLTGRPAFAGDTASDTLAAVLDRDPDLMALPSTTSPFVKRLIEHCLEKDPRRRLREIADAHQTLSDTVTSAPIVAKTRVGRWPVPLVAGVAIGAIVASVVVWQAARRSPVPNTAATQFRLTVPASVRGAADGSLGNVGLQIAITRRVAISRDGRFVVYNGEQDGVSRLYLHRFDQLDSVPIRGAEGPRGEIGSVLLSPDGQWVAYHDGRNGALKKLPIAGGSPSTIYDGGPSAFIPPATWGADGNLIFSSQKTRGLMRVSETGGDATVLTSPQGETHYQPQLIPGGVVIFTIDKDGQRPRVAALSLKTGKYIALVEGFAPRATANGYLLFRRDDGIWAAKFDRETLAITSPPSLVVGDLEWFANFDVADNGTMVYTPTQSGRRVVWVDRQGREEFLPIPAQTYINPRLSPDGNKVILDVRDFRDEGDIWILDLRRGNLDKLTAIAGNKRHAIWTRDGTRVVFSQIDGPRLLDGPSTRARTGKANLYVQRADGIGTPDRLLESALLQYPVSFTADGAKLVLREMGVRHGADWNLRILSLRDRRMESLLASDSYETNGEISPDGNWIAYESEESSRREVYVRPFPDVQAARWRISTNGGREPLWSRNGRELFYLGLDGRLTKVDVTTAPSFSVSTPVRLLNNVYLFHTVSATPGRSYDISPDGSRFLMIKEPVSGNELVVSLNWTAALDK